MIYRSGMSPEREYRSCERYREFIKLPWNFAEEMKLKLQSTKDPTKIVDELFRELIELVKQS